MDRRSSENSPGRQENLIEPASSTVEYNSGIRGLQWVVFIWCALYAALFVYHGIRLTIYPIDVDNSEAFLVYQGARLAQGQFLYSPIDRFPYLVDNYPPVYPAVIALGFLVGDTNFAWPRLVSLISTCFIALIVSLWTLRRTQHRAAALLSGLVFLSFYHVFDWGALARVDALGIAFAMFGLYWFDRNRSWKLSLFFFLLALFTRQTLFAAPLAVLGSLWLVSKRNAVVYLGLLVGIGSTLFVILIGITQGEAWNHLILYNINDYRLHDVWLYLRQWLQLYTVWGCVPIVIWLLEHPWSRNGRGSSQSPSPPSSLLFWFTLFSFGEAMLCGKIGSAPNYWLSFVAAASVGIGTVYHSAYILYKHENRSGRSFGFSIPMVFLLAAFVFQLASSWHWPHTRLVFSYTPNDRDVDIARLVVRDLRRVDSPVLSDRAGAALLAGHAPVYEPFINTQLSLQGLWDQTPLLRQIERKEFSRIVLLFDIQQPSFDRERFTPELIEAVRQNYILMHTIGTHYFYRAKE